jgi:cytochrome c-type biogenesis protein CcmH/NrfG
VHITIALGLTGLLVLTLVTALAVSRYSRSWMYGIVAASIVFVVPLVVVGVYLQMR